METVDIILLTKATKNTPACILLIERANVPFAGYWAFPGGRVNPNEDIYDAAKRELAEETGIECHNLRYIKRYEGETRDPRGPSATNVFISFVDIEVMRSAKAGDDAKKVSSWPLTYLPKLAFDHDDILKDVLKIEKKNKKFCVIRTLSHPELGRSIASLLEVDLLDSETNVFANGEVNVKLKDSVRGKHVIIIATGAKNGGNFNDNLMEVFLTIQACKLADAKKITVVLTHFPYARSDKRDHRGPISVKFVIDTLVMAGATRLIAFDLHSGQAQGCTSQIPFDNLYALDLMLKKIRPLEEKEGENLVIVSPDAGGVKRAKAYQRNLHCGLSYMEKSRSKEVNNFVEKVVLMGGDSVEGKTALVVDDMIDTMGTMMQNVSTLKESKCKDVILVATHGIFSGAALDRLKSFPGKVFVTNTLPIAEEVMETGKVVVIPVDTLLCRALSAIIYGGSIQSLFESSH